MAVVPLLAVGLAAGPAWAERDVSDPKSVASLFAGCEKGVHACGFHPTAYRRYPGESHQVGDAVYNCGPDAVSHTLTWSDTAVESNSLGVEISAGSTVAGLVSAAVKSNYGRVWSRSHTATQSDTMKLGPWSTGWIERAPLLQEVTGDYRVQPFPKDMGNDPKLAFWVRGAVHTGPVAGVGSLVVHTRPMNPDEKDRVCRSGTGGRAAG